MYNRARFVSLVILAIFLASAFAVISVPAVAEEQGQDSEFSDDVPLELQEWVKAQPKQYTPDGQEIPISGTDFFMSKVTTASRETGSRTLNACGTGYDQQGSGTHSYLLIKTGDANYPNATKRQEIKDEFDDPIWPSDTTVFGGASISMIDICMYNMDGAGGLGGYYAGGDNIFVDTGDINSWGYEIIAHEFQHMIHDNRDSDEELWLNEGNADLAILACYGGNALGLQSHVMAFEQFPDNDLTQFDNQGYDYGSSFVYMAYVWEHYGGNATVNALVGNWQNGISSVTGTLSSKGYADTGTDVFYKFAVANIMDDTSFDSAKWGYDTIDIQVSSTSKSSFPATGSGSTNQWAADYYTFTNGGSAQDLEVNFNGASGAYKVYLAAEAKFGSGVESKVVQISLDGGLDGSATIEDFGAFGNFTKVHLVIASANSGGSYSWDADLMDKVPPITTLEINPAVPNGPDGWYTSKPTVTLSTNEEAQIFYHWDTGVDQLYTAALKPPEGQHMLYFHAVDLAANIEGQRGFEIKVDSVKPVTTMTVDPVTPDGTGGWFVTVPTFTLTASEPGKTYYNFDNTPFLNYTAPFKPDEGIHKLKYYTEDAHGLKEDVRSFDLKVDSLVPITNATVSPATPDGKDGWYINMPSIKLETDPGSTIYYWWDGAPETEWVGDIIAVDGVHVLHYYSKDTAGNIEEAKSLELKVDTSIPESEYKIDPISPDGDNGWYVTVPTISLELTKDLTATMFYRFDEADFIEYTDPVPVPEGVHTFNWYAMDPAGNLEPDRTEELQVDTIVPVTTLSVRPDPSANGWYTKIPSVDLNKSEPDAKLYYYWDYENAAILSGALVLPEGRHVLYYYSMDDAGNKEDVKNKEFKIDTQPPTAIITGPIAPEEDSAALFDGSTSKDSNGIVSYKFDFGDGKNSGWISSPTSSHTFKDPGTYTVSLKVQDKAGLESQPQTMTVKVKKKPTTGGIFPPDDDTDPATLPFYKRSYAIAGIMLPFLLWLLILVILLCVIIGAAVGAVRRSRRKAREKALAEAEPVARVREADDDENWRPRRDTEPSYDNEPPMRATEPYEFGYPSYTSMDSEVEAVQMHEPLDKGVVEGPEDQVTLEATPPAPVAKPAAPPPKAQPAPAVAKAAPAATPKPAPARPAPVKPAAPKAEAKPPAKPKEEDALDKSIDDILSRLG